MMWNRVNQQLGSKGFDEDKVLPYREHLIVILHSGGGSWCEEAYVHDGVWHYYENEQPIPKELTVIAWTEFPATFK